MSAKRILITGGTGFVGANLVRVLHSQGHELHLLLRPEYADWRIADIKNDLNLHVAELADLDSLKPLVSSIAPEWIFHLAAYGAYPSQQAWDRMVRTNMEATGNLLQASLTCGFEAFVYTGSSSEYGVVDHPAAEELRLEPNSAYAITKAGATHLCRYYARTFQAPVRVARLYSVYGPYEEPTRLIPNLLIHGYYRSFPRLANPENARDFVHSEDAVQALIRIAADRRIPPGEIYNISSGTQSTIRDLASITARMFDIDEPPDWGSYPDRGWDARTWCGSNQKIRDSLGWSPRFSIAEGLQVTKRWLDEHAEIRAWYEAQVMGGC